MVKAYCRHTIHSGGERWFRQKAEKNVYFVLPQAVNDISEYNKTGQLINNRNLLLKV